MSIEWHEDGLNREAGHVTLYGDRTVTPESGRRFMLSRLCFSPSSRLLAQIYVAARDTGHGTPDCVFARRRPALCTAEPLVTIFAAVEARYEVHTISSLLLSLTLLPVNITWDWQCHSLSRFPITT